MTIQLTVEQSRVLGQNSDSPVHVVDAGTNENYVLVPWDIYERIQSLFTDDELSAMEKRRLLAESGRRAGWDDPEMDIYDDYDLRRTNA